MFTKRILVTAGALALALALALAGGLAGCGSVPASSPSAHLVDFIPNLKRGIIVKILKLVIVGTLALAAVLAGGLATIPAFASVRPAVVLEVVGYHGINPVIKNVGIAPKSFNIMYGGPDLYVTGMHWSSRGSTATGKGTLWGVDLRRYNLGRVTIVLSNVHRGAVSYYQNLRIIGGKNVMHYWRWTWTPKYNEGWQAYK